MAQDRLLLSDGTSHLLLSDGSSFLLLSTTSDVEVPDPYPVAMSFRELSSLTVRDRSSLTFRE